MEGSVLSLSFQGQVSGTDRPRLVLRFHTGDKDRRIPLDIICETDTNGDSLLCHFHGDTKIDLTHVFYPAFISGPVQLSFCLLTGYTEQTLENTLTLPGELFGSFDRVRSAGAGIHRKSLFRFALSTLFLPVIVAIHGLSALIRHRKPAIRTILKQSNKQVKDFSGYSYSIREWKTHYYVTCYQHYCQEPVQSNQILLLSERPLEENSNLGNIRRELTGLPGIRLQEFLVPLPIHRLSRAQIREAARLTATSAVIVLEDFYPQIHALQLRSETKLIQLWHACGAFKTFGFSRLGRPGGPTQDSGNHRSYDYAMVSSSALVPFYSEAFAIPESHVLPLGVPRTDIFFHAAYRERIRQELYDRYPMLSGKKIILFAPTFRGEGNKDAHYPTDRFHVADFLDQLPEDHFLIIRHHPFVHLNTEIPEHLQHRCLDLSGQDSINHLLFLTDLLITDYSSSVFEAALLQIPMLFYAYDKEEYLRDRDCYFPYDSFVPGPIVTEESDLVDAVRTLLNHSETIQDTTASCTHLRSYFLDALDGHSTERIRDFILSLIEIK